MIMLSWITIVGEIGAFSFLLLSIWLGYRLFVLGAEGAFKINATMHRWKLRFESVAPGILFAAMGAVVACWTIHRCVGSPVAVTMLH